MSSDFEESLTAFRAAIDEWAEVDLHGMTTAEIRTLLRRIAAFERRLAAKQHELINQLSMTSPEELGGKLPDVLAKRLRISRGEAVRRIRSARIWAAKRGL